jgi:hypothetical protein
LVSQTNVPKGDEESPDESKPVGKSRRLRPSSFAFEGFLAEAKALRALRERLARSSRRPNWWASHVRGYFR